MKYKSVSCIVILFITLTFIFGCKKDNSKRDYYEGNYSFTVTTTEYPDSVIHYDGTITYYISSKLLIIWYMEENSSSTIPYTISPNVDENGVLSFPDWTKNDGFFFNGNIDFDGNINFKIGRMITPQGQTIESSRTVTGKKKQE